MADKAFGRIGYVVRLLPAGTFSAYQLLTPLLTSTGTCQHWWNKVTTLAILAFCAFLCAFSTFTDSYVDAADGKVRYGLVTPGGLWLFGERQPRAGLAAYRLRKRDFAHAVAAVVMFATLALVADANTASCFFPALEEKRLRAFNMALPAAVGSVATVVFAVYPWKRHGIGYPMLQPEAAGGGGTPAGRV